MLVYEYCFKEGSYVTDLLQKDVVTRLRKDYAGDCFNLACDMHYGLTASGYLSSVLTFKNGNAYLGGGISVRNELMNCESNYTHHSIVLLGDCVIDLLHSDRMIATPTYVESLKKHNPLLRLDYTMSGCWFDLNGYPLVITIDRLLHNNWDS